MAKEIVSSTRGRIAAVGVFVNHRVGEIQQLTMELGLDFCQLHGDETPELLRELVLTTRVIRAIRVSDDSLGNCQHEFRKWRDAGAAAILLDPKVDGQFGGSGVQMDWNVVQQMGINLPLILAGGLNQDNVARAIQLVRPAAVDVASGVESAPGKKDRQRVLEFVAQATAAFQKL